MTVMIDDPAATIRISAIEPQKHHLERVNVYVDGEFYVALAHEVVMRAGLRRGDEITQARLDELEAEDLFWKARDSSLNLLSFRARTATELARRLRDKGFPEDVVERCVAELVERGLVDDSAFAETFVRDRVRLRPSGARRLAQELRVKGVDADTASEAIEEVLRAEDVSELELARVAVRKWARRSGEGQDRARRRLYGFLSRRGFGGDTVRQVMEELDL
ncbi:MAG: recombination regulator RecX [Gemmatimonadetes bacterium]|nr:recombination regulator RecX [Gemmatimonadota bacterium]